jgi:cytochrome c553
MRMITKAAVLAAALSLPMAAFSAQTAATAGQKKAPAASAKKSTAMASHTTAGTVKSVSDTSLVVTKGTKDQTFTVNASTEKKGTIEAGSHVTVHYTMDGANMVATAITAQPAKKAAKTPKK